MNFAVLIVAVLTGCVSAELDWWQTAQFYQIYPRSFKDSNGDGIGDLNGITENLEYLQELGITAAWISPIFQSPMKDFGYDITDYTAIQPEYGTMDDFDRLIRRAEELGVKIILDLVPNHSSDQHDWFKKSVNRESGYEDFYVWHSGYRDPKSASKRLPPSNWLSVTRGSAWQWNAKRQQFYLHQFLSVQPDLNYRNPQVIKAMEGVLEFWLDKGIAGFRVDAVPQIYEVSPDSSGRYPDEPRSNGTSDPNSWTYLDHIYTQDQSETLEHVYRIRAYLDEYQRKNGGDTRVILAETDSPPDIIMQYYGNGTENGAQIPFNFKFIKWSDRNSNARDLSAVIDIWMNNIPPGCTPDWVMGNHDNRRTGSRYGPQRIDGMNMLLMILPGASVTYNGEEIGMLDNEISWKETVDPAACTLNEKIYKGFSRDPARSPFQWDDSKNAGFSTANKTWLPVNPNYKSINVKEELTAPRSHLKVFKDLVKLRTISRALQVGNLKYQALSTNVLAIQRSVGGSNTILLLMNISSKTETVDAQYLSGSIPASMNVRIVNVESKRNAGDVVETSEVILNPYESLVLEQ